MKKKKICLIHTGGTIGMTRSEDGYIPSPGYLRGLLDGIADLYVDGMPSFDLYELSPLLDSSNMAVNEWNMIGGRIAELYSEYDGFVILHGTDTMAYTASSLSFMLENLDKPVILTGSQIPLCEIRSDGRDNLITSIMIAAEGVVREVCLYFGGKLLRGNRATKMSADGLLAFASPNMHPLAEAGINIRYNQPIPIRRSGKFSFHPFSEVPIGVLKVFPGINFSLFDVVMTEKLRGVVLETFGAGNIPGEGNSLLPIIKAAFAAGAVITVCSQCPQGTVSLGAYAASSELVRAGAVSGFDMTTEAAVAKLYYLFSLGYDKEQIKRMMETDLRGELTRA
ncbi:MAG: asparaginase [Ruminococcaceae bacterium]|nr:asparaginase [Oscillospiraceae bacterium]